VAGVEQSGGVARVLMDAAPDLTSVSTLGTRPRGRQAALRLRLG